MDNILMFIIALCYLTNSCFAQQPELDWAVSFGGTGSDYGRSVAIDSEGYIYTIGSFLTPADLDPGIDTLLFVNPNNTSLRHAYIQKLNQNGELVWVKTFGNQEYSFMFGNSICTDNSNNIYVTGMFVDTVDFDPGPNVYNLNALLDGDAFILKLNNNGEFQWVKQISSENYDIGHSIQVDQFQNVVSTGSFAGDADFDPGPDEFILTNSGVNKGYIQKLDSNGNFLWANSLGRSVNYVNIDINNHIYVSMNLSITGDDIVLKKIDENGDAIWQKTFTGTSFNFGESIAFDNHNNLYFTGSFRDSINFVPFQNNFTYTSQGSNDIFILKIDPFGELIWVKQIGGIGFDKGNAIITDDFGNLFVTGYFEDVVDFDPGPNVNELISQGESNSFVLNIDSTGVFKWVEGIIGSGVCNGHDIELDQIGNIFTIGNFTETFDFDPDTSVLNFASQGLFDVFLTKQNSCDSYSTEVYNTCSPFTWLDGVTYNSSNNTATYIIAGATVEGCDSLLILDLTVNENVYTTDVIETCDIYTWIDGITYTQDNNTASFTYPAATINGCDSIVYLDLTVNDEVTFIDSQEACGSFSWIDGNTYMQSNNTASFTYEAATANGCDSIVLIDLTISAVSGNTTILNGSSITAINTNAAYQWLDCNNNYTPIAGENNQEFTAMLSGSYAVQLSENGCVDTSACVQLEIVGQSQNLLFESLTVYPNPNNGEFVLDFGTTIEEGSVEIVDITGSSVYAIQFQNISSTTIEVELPSGLYLFKVESTNGLQTLPLFIH